jgi:hypothetical protein
MSILGIPGNPSLPYLQCVLFCPIGASEHMGVCMIPKTHDNQGNAKFHVPKT